MRQRREAASQGVFSSMHSCDWSFCPPGHYTASVKDGSTSRSLSEGAGCKFTIFHQSSFGAAFLALPACDARDMQFVLFGINPI